MNWMHSACLPQAPLHVTPKIGYVNLSVTPLSTLVPFSPLVHINGDNADSPKKIPDTENYTVTLNTIPHTSSNTRCHLNIPLSHFVSNTNKPKLHESCSTKSKPYSMLQIKKTFFVVLLKKSFVIHLCCLKNIVLEKLTISRNTKIKTKYRFYYMDAPHGR